MPTTPVYESEYSPGTLLDYFTDQNGQDRMRRRCGYEVGVQVRARGFPNLYAVRTGRLSALHRGRSPPLLHLVHSSPLHCSASSTTAVFACKLRVKSCVDGFESRDDRQSGAVIPPSFALKLQRTGVRTCSGPAAVLRVSTAFARACLGNEKTLLMSVHLNRDGPGILTGLLDIPRLIRVKSR